MSMDLPVSDPTPVKDASPSFDCEQCDMELVHKIAQVLLPGLATACIDNTTGGLFKGPAAVAFEIRKEMVDYLTQRSENYIVEIMIQGEGNADPVEEISDDPVEIVQVFLDDFAGMKRNFFSRVSGWLLSESREDKIDDFVQEMEINAFWKIDRRESIAMVLLRNVDLKSAYHCSTKFGSAEQLAEHKTQCNFRISACPNEGCKTKFSAARAEKHDMECPYKILPCDQLCSQTIMRRDMDRHCITVCTMKLMNCPFHQVGCQSAFPHCTLQNHCSESLSSHLLYVLQALYKQEASMEELKKRVELMEQSESLSELSEALDVRSLTHAIKEHERNMKKREHEHTEVSI